MGAQWQDKRWQVQTEAQEVPFEQETLFYCEGAQTLEQVSQGGCRVSLIRDNQNLSGYSPQRPAVAEPAWAVSLD